MSSAPTLHAPLTVIEVAEAADLSALMADSRLAPLILARIAPTVAITTTDKCQSLLDALKKAGHTPKVVR
jgi:hypothetical protein